MPCTAFTSCKRAAPAAARRVHARVARPSRAVAHVQHKGLPALDPVWWWTTALASPLLFSGAAQATEGQLGILEGRSVALVHPIVMVTLFFTTAYTGWLGWQWRETRTIGDKIKDLKKEQPKPDSEGNTPSSPVDSEIEQLQSVTYGVQKRKELTQGNFKDRHHQVSSLLLGFGTVVGIEGALNTYTRLGKLVPGPHLFGGASIVCLWAIAASLVPAMQKGNDTARTMHISANVLNLGLFAWQLPTGWAIVQKVLQFAPLP